MDRVSSAAGANVLLYEALWPGLSISECHLRPRRWASIVGPHEAFSARSGQGVEPVKTCRSKVYGEDPDLVMVGAKPTREHVVD